MKNAHAADSLLNRWLTDRHGLANLLIDLGGEMSRSIYAVLLAPLGGAPWVIGMASVFYGGLAIAAGALFIFLSWQLFCSDNHAVAQRLFGFSILYLFVLFMALVADRAIHQFLTSGFAS